MKLFHSMACALVLWGLGTQVCSAQPATLLVAQQSGSTSQVKPPATQPASAQPAKVGYVPPVRGAPTRRVGGSSRGAGDELPMIVALVPEQVGLTTQETPVLYWYLSKPTKVRIDVTLIDELGIHPLLEVSVPQNLAAGIHAVRLSDYGVTLKMGTDYEWSVALVLDPEQRSMDIISMGAIQKVAQGKFASESVWYDMMAGASSAVAAKSGNRETRLQRAALLEDAGLKEVAAYERGLVN